jgi:MFS family permease
MKRLDTASNRALGRVSFLIVGLSVGAVIAFALAGNFWLAVVFSMLTGVFRSLFGPIESTWINQNLDSNVRATVISMRGQVDAFGQTFGGPPVGWVGNTFGIRAALVSSALILSPALVLYTRLLRRPDAAIALPDEAAVVSEEGALA